MSKNVIVTLAVSMATGVVAYVLGRNHFDNKKESLKKDISDLKEKKEKASKELSAVKEEVSSFIDIKKIDKEKARLIKETEQLTSMKEAKQKECIEVGNKLKSLQNSLTSEFKRMDPNYESYLLSEIKALKKMNDDLERKNSSLERRSRYVSPTGLYFQFDPTR